ncbi:MAG: type II secretion system protein [Dehalococcoidia bacterium]
MSKILSAGIVWFRGSRLGFTLVEMLVVVAIIVALAAVIVPTVTILLGQGEEGAQKAEWATLQSAFDAMMTNEGFTTVGPDAAGGEDALTRDFRAVDFDLDAVGEVFLPPDYMRDKVTQFCYTWDGTGGILSQADPAGAGTFTVDSVEYQDCT